ncbi:MAG: DNA-directed RNA polymerase subunit alpha [Metamycoplasmataceae bacterium]
MSKLTKLNYNEVKINKISDNNSSFIIQPLERGMSNTIGTALRRVLLSSIYGVSAFAIKIAGITHEYTAIKDVSVDVLTLSHTLSKIKFIYNENVFAGDKILKIYFKSSKEGVVKIKDLELPSELKLATGTNIEEEIAILSSKEALEFELFIKSGRGYIDSERNKLLINERRTDLNSKLKSGTILALDSNFSPIIKISHKTEELNTSSYDIQEKLEINIETNGSIDCKTALSYASKILMAHLTIIGDISNLDLNDIFEEKEIKKEVSKFDSMTIDDLDLTVRSSNGLRRSKITKISELINLTENELRNITSIGEKSVKEIIEKLKEKKIELSKGDE